MKKSAWAVLMMAFVAMIAGCATTSGVNFDENKLSQFVPGQTTISQAEQALGEPNNSISHSDGSKQLVYTYTLSKTNGAEFIPVVGSFLHKGSTDLKQAYIDFDAHGRFLKYSVDQEHN